MRFVDRRDAGRRTPASLVAIGQWYEDFRQTSDEEVVELLGGTDT